jgi:hypothetical protein
MLSKTNKRKRQLDKLRHETQYIEWMIDPFPQITVRKEVPPEKGNKIGERPPEPGFELKVFDKQYGNQCCPNLDIKRILGGTHN